MQFKREPGVQVNGAGRNNNKSILNSNISTKYYFPFIANLNLQIFKAFNQLCFPEIGYLIIIIGCQLITHYKQILNIV